MEFVLTAKAVVLVNGLTTNEFRISKGVRQENSLSPFLFILVKKVFHLMLEKVEGMGIGGIQNVIPEQ